MSDYYSENLLGCSFREIGFPALSFKTRISQDIAEHKRPDQDGGRVESTGRNPMRFSCVIPCRNSLARGKNETWGVLYPTTWRQILAAMSDRSKGTLQHPSLGRILVKPVSCDSSLEAGSRDGEDISAEWVEYSEDEDASNAILGGESPIGGAMIEAIDLDSTLASSGNGGFDPDGDEMSLEEAMRKVAAVADTTALLTKKSFGMIDRLVYRLDAIHASYVAIGDPQNWQPKQSVMRLRAYLAQIKKAALAGPKDVRIYITPAPMTLAIIANKFANPVGDIIRLNPDLVSTPQVPARTVVRYYAANQ